MIKNYIKIDSKTYYKPHITSLVIMFQVQLIQYLGRRSILNYIST